MEVRVPAHAGSKAIIAGQGPGSQAARRRGSSTVNWERADLIAVFFGNAEYQNPQGKFDFDGKMIVGNIHSGTAHRLIREWATLPIGRK